MEKINKLKKIFKREKIDGYIIPKNDEFFCEYSPSHNDRLKYITNFTGSYGFALILKKKIIYLLMEDILYKLKIKVENILKLLLFLKKCQRYFKK